MNPADSPRAARRSERGPPALDAADAALGVYAAEIAAARHERLMQDLPSDVLERIFGLGFALEQLHRNFIDLARCVSEIAHSNIAQLEKLAQDQAN